MNEKVERVEFITFDIISINDLTHSASGLRGAQGPNLTLIPSYVHTFHARCFHPILATIK